MPSGTGTSRSAGMTPRLAIGAERPAGIGDAVARLQAADARPDLLDDARPPREPSPLGSGIG